MHFWLPLWTFYNANKKWTPQPTPFADEDCEMQLEVSKTASKGTFEIISSHKTFYSSSQPILQRFLQND